MPPHVKKHLLCVLLLFQYGGYPLVPVGVVLFNNFLINIYI